MLESLHCHSSGAEAADSALRELGPQRVRQSLVGDNWRRGAMTLVGFSAVGTFQTRPPHFVNQSERHVRHGEDNGGKQCRVGIENKNEIMNIYHDDNLMSPNNERCGQ